RRYTLSGDKLFYIVRQYLMLRATSYLNSASVPNRPLHSFSRETADALNYSLSARRSTLLLVGAALAV
ncbi:hypothetical protein GW17_00014886, partial [Ensete ventricosum]